MKISNEELKVAIIGSSAIMRDILDRVNEGKKESEQITIQGLHQRIKESPEFSELMAREKDEIDDEDAGYNPEDEEFGSDATPFNVATVSISLPDGVKKRAEAFAKNNSLTMSDLVTAALNTYLEGR
jgi:hypothetical protein